MAETMRPLQLRVAVNLRARNNVLRVPVMSLVVDELAGVAQHGRGSQPALVLGRQLVQRFSSRKSCTACARTGSACGIDAVAPRRGQHALPALVLELAMRLGARVLLGQHLRQNAVAQAQRRVAETGRPKLSSSSA
jgi:hypothetical protein